MGCGCRKKYTDRKLTDARKAGIRAKAQSALIEKRKKSQQIKFKDKIIKTRLAICETCPFSVQTDRDRKYGIRICHKENRPIQVVAATLSSSCPINRFKSCT